MNMADPVQCEPKQAPVPLSAEADAWIDRHLHTWARWMRRDSDELAEGFLKRSTVLVGFTHQDGRGDHLYDKLDGFVAEAVDSCIASLSPAESAAVKNHWRLAVFRFPRGNERSLYLSAKVRLIPMLRRRNVV